jgi:predicted DCC family thiol-disulfide oxidoreductase YuxK
MKSTNGIILFDGVCNVCNEFVQFVIKRDPEGYFQFASLQSEAGKQLLKKYQLPDSLETVVLIENDKAYTYSTAPLRVTRHLRGLWKIGFVFIIVPPFIRHAIYRFIARNRYRWFGKKESCMMPTPAIEARFL